MKLSQLMLAGDYLTYKGDWVTNTAYKVNDIVTWAADGHLYQVIKAHTSSSTFDPDNAEYYKPMTNKTFSEVVYDLSNATSRAAFFAALNNVDKRPFVKIVGTVESSVIEFNIVSTSASLIKLLAFNFTAQAMTYYCMSIPSDAAPTTYKFGNDVTTITNPSLTVTNLD